MHSPHQTAAACASGLPFAAAGARDIAASRGSFADDSPCGRFEGAAAEADNYKVLYESEEDDGAGRGAPPRRPSGAQCAADFLFRSRKGDARFGHISETSFSVAGRQGGGFLRLSQRLLKVFRQNNGVVCLNRHVLLALYMMSAFMTACIYFGWPAMKAMLFKSGAYAWLCDEETDGPSGKGGSTGRVSVEGYAYLCDAQDGAISALFVVCLVSHSCMSAGAGVLLDYAGPKVTAMIGQSLGVVGWVLLALSGERFPAYVPAAMCVGLSADTCYLPLLRLVGLFSHNRATVISLLGTASTGSFAIPMLLRLIWSRLPELSFPQLAVGYIMVGPCASLLIALLCVPWRGFDEWSALRQGDGAATAECEDLSLRSRQASLSLPVAAEASGVAAECGSACAKKGFSAMRCRRRRLLRCVSAPARVARDLSESRTACCAPSPSEPLEAEEAGDATDGPGGGSSRRLGRGGVVSSSSLAALEREENGGDACRAGSRRVGGDGDAEDDGVSHEERSSSATASAAVHSGASTCSSLSSPDARLLAIAASSGGGARRSAASGVSLWRWRSHAQQQPPRSPQAAAAALRASHEEDDSDADTWVSSGGLQPSAPLGDLKCAAPEAGKSGEGGGCFALDLDPVRSDAERPLQQQGLASSSSLHFGCCCVCCGTPMGADVERRTASSSVVGKQSAESSTTVGSGESVVSAFFSLRFLCILCYSASQEIAMAYFQSSAERLLHPTVAGNMDVFVSLSFIPCVFIGMAIDFYGPIPVLFAANTTGLFAYVFALLGRINAANGSLTEFGSEGLVLHAVSLVCFCGYISLDSEQVFCYVDRMFAPRHFGRLCGFAQLCAGLTSLITIPLYNELSLRQLHGNCQPAAGVVLGILVSMYLLLGLTYFRTRGREAAKEQMKASCELEVDGKSAPLSLAPTSEAWGRASSCESDGFRSAVCQSAAVVEEAEKQKAAAASPV